MITMSNNNGWIKCSEGLPEIGQKVFILIRPLTPEECEYCDGTEKPWQEAGWLDRRERWITSDDRYEFDRVTHWRPQFELPEPPKEEE
ncbi:MAG: DUF551 domain-containing protein [Desulfurellales bacterium]|nr:MAG: DUF551 domain-containing protein [Desulfurellales bacterium]